MFDSFTRGVDSAARRFWDGAGTFGLAGKITAPGLWRQFTRLLSLLPGIAIFWANHAQALTFSWSPDPTPSIAGYRLHYGTISRAYTNIIDVGNFTTATPNGLLAGTSYYFAVTSYTTAGVESPFSPEITYTVPASTSGAPTQGLVCCWTFDEGSGAVAIDSSGAGNTGKLINSPIWSSGRIGGALSFNGLNNAVSTPAINLSGTRAVTVALWVNRTYSKTGGHSLFESTTGIGGSTTGFMLFPDDSSSCAGGGMLIGLRGDAGYNLKCFAQPSSGVWHHLVAIFDKSQNAPNEVSLYVDGALQTARAQSASSDNSNNFGNNPFYLMARSGSGDFCAGLIDDVRIYGRAVSASEVQQIYSLGSVLNKQAMQLKAISPGATDSSAPAPGIITSQYVQDGLFAVTVAGDTGRSYAVEASSDALHWAQIDIVVPVDGVATFNQPVQSDHQFYRVRPLP